jgi:hypothetical protein
LIEAWAGPTASTSAAVVVQGSMVLGQDVVDIVSLDKALARSAVGDPGL